MMRTPPRLPAPRVAYRILRNPPEPLITGPCVGRSNNANWSAAYDSSSMSSVITLVKIGVSTKRHGQVYAIGVGQGNSLLGRWLSGMGQRSANRVPQSGPVNANDS